MENLDKLLEAIEYPERFSESELRELLSDPESKKLYRLMCASRAETFTRDLAKDDSDVDKKWKKFKLARQKKKLFSFFYNRKAAAVVALLIASCSIIMVGVSLKHRNISKQETHQTTIMETVAEDTKEKENLPVNDTVIILEEEKMDRILTEVAPYYNVKVDLKSPGSKDVRLFLRWESTTNVSALIDHLNSFERINLYLKDDIITDY